MAVKRDSRYPGRWTPADADFPLGGPKNRTTYTSKDGSYFDREWIADHEAFYQRLMSEAGIAANGSSDTAPTSQFYNALIIESTKATAGWWNSSAMKTKLDGIQAGAQVNRPLGSGAGQVCEGNDPRLSNAREWVADIVPQSESEAGTSVTPRKWTAQRVNQASNSLVKSYGLGVEDWPDGISVGTLETGSKSGFSIAGNTTPGGPGGRSGFIISTGIRAGRFGYIYLTYAPLQKNSPDCFLMIGDNSSPGDWCKLLHSGNEMQIGVNQNYIDVKSERFINVVYTNNTDKPIFVYIAINAGTPNPTGAVLVDDLPVGLRSSSSVSGNQFIVPPGSTYKVVSGTILEWVELR